jgi:hypothetical protein
MALSYQNDLKKFTQDLLEMTKEGLISWDPIYLGGNKFTFEFIGDNGVKYSLTYEWEFSNDSWALKLPNLIVFGRGGSMEGFRINLYNFTYPAVKELGEFLLPKDFLPSDKDDVDSKMTTIMSGYCKRGERSIKISDILDDGKSP